MLITVLLDGTILQFKMNKYFIKTRKIYQNPRE